MAFDREGTLRTAEKLVRQGKLDVAIAEYRRVIDDQPNDWNTANTLGDLYFRAGQIDKAAAEYERIADHFANEGFYLEGRRALQENPQNQTRRRTRHVALGRSRGPSGTARRRPREFSDARRAPPRAWRRRGEAEVRVELGDLDGADIETRLAGARARAEMGEVATAVLQLKQCAADLQGKGKDEAAVQLLTEAARLGVDPPEPELAGGAHESSVDGRRDRTAPRPHC